MRVCVCEFMKEYDMVLLNRKVRTPCVKRKNTQIAVSGHTVRVCVFTDRDRKRERESEAERNEGNYQYTREVTVDEKQSDWVQ